MSKKETAAPPSKDGKESPQSIKEHFEGEYDPHLHRVVEKPTTDAETFVHLLKCVLGTGLVAMPQAFSRAGVLVGTVATIAIGVMLTHCIHILINSQYIICKSRRVAFMTYNDSVEAAFQLGPKCFRSFAKCGAKTVDFFLVIYQLGICCVYIVFIAETLKALVDPFVVLSIEVHSLILLGPLIVYSLIRDLKMLAPFSSLANILMLLGSCIILYFLLSDKMTPGTMDLTSSIEKFPLYFGTTLFSLTAIGVVVQLESNMKNPKTFGRPFGVLNLGMAVVVILYIVIGAAGYNFCLDKCDDDINRDLPQGFLSTTNSVFFGIAIFISYGLQFYVPVAILWKQYMLPRLQRRGSTSLLCWEISLRIFLCVITFALAISVPRLGLFISLFGALCLSVLGVMFPAIIEICVCYPDKHGPLNIKLFKNILLIIVGILGLSVGTSSALGGIIDSFQ